MAAGAGTSVGTVAGRATVSSGVTAVGAVILAVRAVASPGGGQTGDTVGGADVMR